MKDIIMIQPDNICEGSFLHNQMDLIMNVVNNLNTKVNEMTKSNSDLTNKVEELTKSNSDLTNKVDELTKSNSDLTNKVIHLTKSNEELTNKVDILNDIVVNELVETMIRNVACNIVFYFLGEQPKDFPSDSKRFQSTYNLKKLERLVKENNIISSKNLGKNLDKMINERNVCVHPVDLAELKGHVEKCIQYFTTFPELKMDYTYELFIIDNYDNFVKYI